MMTNTPFIFVFTILAIVNITALELRVMELTMLSSKDAEMHSPLKLPVHGGTITMKIWNGLEFCETGALDTDDDNWENGERNYFVGKQLNGCENFVVGANSNRVKLEITHEGHDTAGISKVKLRGSLRNQEEYLCEINSVLLQNISSVYCTKVLPLYAALGACQGHRRFCTLAYNNATFAGSHNAGTGMAVYSDKSYKYQDLSPTEQLDFGLRFFDINVIYNTTLDFCNGLETGIGESIENESFRCYGRISDFFNEVTTWLNRNWGQIVTIHFSSILDESTTWPHLKDEINKWFIGADALSPIKLNEDFQKKGRWPLLGDMVANNSKIMMFVTLKEETDTDAEDVPYIRVLKVDTADENNTKPETRPGTVSMISTFDPRTSSYICEDMVNRVEYWCEHLQGDLIKVVTYASRYYTWYSRSESARMCNPKAEKVMSLCKNYKPLLNFVLADYPNYPGGSEFTLPELVDRENVYKFGFNPDFDFYYRQFNIEIGNLE